MALHKLFWGSSYDRGLDTLLFMWPDIVKEFPGAEMHICYGWDLFDRANHNNPERMAWKKNVQTLMSQKGIVHHGRVGQEELKKIRKGCDVWAYPTWFPEINCITALECQNDGVIPVTMDDFALKETVGSGIKIKGDIKDPKVQEKYLKSLLDLLKDPKRMKKESKKAKNFAKKYFWKGIAKEWDTIFKQPVSTPRVSVITITIREGFWNIMADILSKQTYKNFEWVIVDDYKEDRSHIAAKYGEKHGLNIKYIWGDKAQGKYNKKYGIARANNTGWKAAEGDLCVFLQDFIIIPTDGIEALVGLYRHNPNAILAPVDQYWHPIDPNKKNKEDWWDGETDVIDRFSWRNERLKFAGIRESSNPFEFEMNYAAAPKHIIEYVNGWYEFFDDGIGYDNTEFAYRVIESGFKLIVDDTNVAQCIEIGHHGFDLNVEDWAKFKASNYPHIRTLEADK